jgi:hypothetical protein
MILTRNIHPRVTGPDGKLIRRRRTNSEIAEAESRTAAIVAATELKAQWAAMLPLARKRLAEATAGQRRSATRTINRTINGPRYRWEK